MKLLRETIRKLITEGFGPLEFEEEVKPQVIEALERLGAKRIRVTREEPDANEPTDWGLQIHFSLGGIKWMFAFVDGQIYVFENQDGVYNFAYQYDVPDEVQINRTLADWLYNEMKYLPR